MFQEKSPLYIQIAEEMRNNIRSEKWLPNTKIPTEYDLCDIYHVSRITIRKAIDELVRDNLLEKKKPVGTFVKSIDPNSYKNYTLVKSFTMEMKEIGVDVETLKVSIIVSHADHHIAKYLNIKPGDKIIILKRLRGVKNNGFAFFKTYLKFEEYYSLKSSDYYGSLYKYLNALNIYMVDDKEIVEAILPNKEISLWLGILPSTPVLKRLRFTSSTDKMQYEYTECYYVGSEYRYFIDFSRINI